MPTTSYEITLGKDLRFLMLVMLKSYMLECWSTSNL